MELVIVIICILLTGFFAGYETGYVSFNRAKLFYLQEKKNKKALQLSKLYENPERILSMTLIGTNIGMVTASTYFTVFIEKFNFNISSEIIVSLTLTPFILVFAEIIPKTLFRQHADKWVLVLTSFVTFLNKVLYILVVIFTNISNLMLKMIGADRKEGEALITKDELEMLVDMGDIHSDERKMIKSVFDLSELQVKEIMVPRIKINGISEKVTLKSIFKMYDDCQNTRIPVYNEDIDKITGIFNVLDILYKEIEEENFDIKNYIRTPFFIPETKNVNELFTEMRKRKEHIAVVLDEYGGTAGLVTLEDIIEEIFGEIYDEFDQKNEFRFSKEDENTLIVNSALSLNDLEDDCFIELKCDNEDIDTIGGFLINHFGKIPKIKDKITIKNYEFEIIDATRTNIKKIKITKLIEKSEN